MTEDVTSRRLDANPETTVLQTLVRGLDVLDVVATGQSKATAKTIAHTLGLNLGTCYHLLRTLRTEGYIVRVEGGTYDVGPRGGRLGRNLELRFGPSPEISALLSRLHNKTQETAYVCGWYHGSIVMQQFMSGTKATQVRQLEVGYTGNMHARASCKSVLAHLPPDIIAAMFSGVTLERLTPHTIGTYGELVQQLTRVRRWGYAIDEEEFDEGVCCVSAPFFDAEGNPVGSFTVSVPAQRWAAIRAAITAEVLEVANLATILLRTGRLVVSDQSNPRTSSASDRRSRR